MFTGIVEEIGSVKAVKRNGPSLRLTLTGDIVLQDVKLGDSISVNGICLTVTTFDERTFAVDVMPETLKASSLDGVRPGTRVNLERAMPANGRFGGHFVSGHVDGVGRIVKKRPLANAVYVDISCEPSLLRYIVPKGSISVDGTSLTVFDVTERGFTLSLIPHTYSETVLGMKQAGDTVNLECDMLAKYMEKLVNQKPMTLESLASQGYGKAGW
ncbi:MULTISPECIES: riboflavin synthase [Exiguobacterium]|uniref:Riboflavin synthase n=1 Tax=Exiguobacterium alkaliphilum TaxID=1428684 RepID=A0ABT2KXW1_9BACL|nr:MULTISPECIES: riboflavin synthase [Exiguobacterium]MCT4795762.1 riboflavin synthase [Exiguobacterium alkaliphilum]QUE87350.1 riboflavin synthase [Exiguobacterium alkaliphilum]